jgi:MYXO-CTERM domain-containing protein
VNGKVYWPYDDSDEMVPVEEITKMLEARLEGRLGRGRIADGEHVEPEIEVGPELVVATPPVVVVEEAAPVEDSSPAPWIVLGAAAVAFGFAVGTRRRR